MGLDMYLNKKTYVKNWDHRDEKHSIVVLKDNEIRHDIKPNRITNIEEENMYWRKEDAIHGWIVRNIQDGIK